MSTLDRGQRTEPESVVGAVHSLLRAAHILRAYPETNQMCQRAMDDLGIALVEVVPLEIELGAEEITWCGHKIIDPATQSSTLLSTLFRDGIRRIRIQQGIEEPEIRRFVKAIGQPLDPDDPGEDYVTRLWESNLTHIAVASINPYLDVDLPEDVLEGKTKPTEEVEECAPNPTADLPPVPESAFEITDEDALYMQEEIAAASLEPPWDNFVRAVLDLCESTESDEKLARVAPVLEAAIQRLLSGLQIDLVTTTVRRFCERAAELDTPVLNEAINRVADPQRLSVLHTAIDQNECDQTAAAEFFRALGSSAVDAICVFLSMSRTDHVRRFYSERLEEAGPEGIDKVLEYFNESDPEARIHFARILGQLRSEEAVAPLLAAIHDENPRVRQECLYALASIGGEAALSKLLEIALEDATAESRIVALQGLSRVNQPLDAQVLVQRIQSRSFQMVPEEEKDLLYRALGLFGGDDAISLLEKTLKPSWVPGRDRTQDWQRAADALANIGTPAAVRLLERSSRSRRRNLAKICAKALHRGQGEPS